MIEIGIEIIEEEIETIEDLLIEKDNIAMKNGIDFIWPNLLI